MNKRPEPVMDEDDEIKRLRRERDEARAAVHEGGALLLEFIDARKRSLGVIRALYDAFGPARHDVGCGCDQCEALAAAKKELER